MDGTLTSAGPVIYHRDGPAVWLTINRPEARNALNAEVRRGLFEGFERFNLDPDAKVLVLTGAGDKAFSAGADLKEMSEKGLTVPPLDFLPQIGRNITVDKPVIGAINGACLAGGFLLAQNCDLLICSSHATFGVTEVRVGRGVPWAVPLPTMIPRAIAMEILLTGAPISATRAYYAGLVNDVVDGSALRKAAQHLAERVAANAPLSVLAAKKTVHLMTRAPIAAAFAEAERLWEPVYHSKDAQEGPAAFREGRAPQWSGQ